MAKAKKITIELVPIRRRIDRATNQAKRSIARGEKAIRTAMKEGRREDARKNRDRLAKAKNALARLKQSQRLMTDACCNQRFNCDPLYL
jgi:hypothetical protein